MRTAEQTVSLFRTRLGLCTDNPDGAGTSRNDSIIYLASIENACKSNSSRSAVNASCGTDFYVPFPFEQLQVQRTMMVCEHSEYLQFPVHAQCTDRH